MIKSSPYFISKIKSILYRAVLLASILGTSALTYSAEKDSIKIIPASSFKTLMAKRIETPIIIDGKLDDEAWNGIEIATSFTQRKPKPGKKSTQKTEVKIAYDDNAMYVGATIYDAHRDSLRTQLSERDGIANTDYFGIFIDTYNDNLTGYGFMVLSTGVQWDGRYSSFGEDDSWDAVWKSDVFIGEDGTWYIEMKIPYSAIRFPNNEEQVWGLQFSRKINRLGEHSFWTEFDPEINGFVNQFGELRGIKNIKPPVRLSLTPYLSGYVDHYPYDDKNINDLSSSFNGGMDIKYGISDAFTIDMTLIPDFGQVQSDNQVLNLSPFEVQYNERRPFFIEGTELFNKGDLFYSRRIGGEPIGFWDAQESGHTIIDNPGRSQIINASKISGRTNNGLGIGVFNGITKEMTAIVEDSLGFRHNIMTDPTTNYSVMVLDQNLRNGSYFTFVNTNVWREGSTYDANVSGVQFELNDSTYNWALRGAGALSQQYYQDHIELGQQYKLRVVKTSGNFNFRAMLDLVDDKYDPNDLGFQFYNNQIEYKWRSSYNIYEPYSIFNSSETSFGLNFNQLYTPNKYMSSGVYLAHGVEFKNFHSLEIWTYNEPFESKDFYEPRVDGRFYTGQKYFNMGIDHKSDKRKKVSYDWGIDWQDYDKKERHQLIVYAKSNFIISDKLSLEYGINNELAYNDEGVAIDNEGYSTIINDTIIFGKRDQKTLTNLINLKYVMNNKMGLTFRLRHYWSTVKYNSFHALNKEGYLAESNFTGLNSLGESNYNFSYDALNIDMVYRWRFAPGSELSLVWKAFIEKEDNIIDRT
ncbi:MAG: carbohydrate binding family 9 domain-containing protein, partial [Flavobacteriales bacterium]|nr:carbohydrate binding family 9 domain-containing protein [Flavobacteriales bacterium]